MVDGPEEPDFTIGDILRTFEERLGPPKKPHSIDPEKCYTTEELSEMWGIRAKKIREILKELRNNKLLIETIKYVEPLGRPGIEYPVPAYQIIGEDKSGED